MLPFCAVLTALYLHLQSRPFISVDLHSVSMHACCAALSVNPSFLLTLPLLLLLLSCGCLSVS